MKYYSISSRPIGHESRPKASFGRFTRNSYPSPAAYNKYQRRIIYVSEARAKGRIPDNLQQKRRTVSHPESTLQPDFSIPGLEKLLHSSRFGYKFVWLCAIFAFYGLCVYQLTDRVTLYFQAPIALDVRIEKVEFIDFPSVTMCPAYEVDIFNIKLEKLRQNNIVLRTPYELAGLNFTLEDMWNEFSFDREFVGRVYSTCSYSDSHDEPSEETIDENNDDQKKDSFASNKQPCNMVGISLKEDPTIWGMCLHLTPNAHVEYLGAWTYIQLTAVRFQQTLNYRLNELLWGLEHDVVFIPHLESVTPTHEFAKLFYRVRKGVEASVSFSVKKYLYLNTEKNPCIDEKASNDCKEQCLKDRLNNTVDCSLPFMKDSSHQPCSSLLKGYNALLSARKVYREFDGCDCPRPCQETVLNYNSDYHSAPTDQLAVFILSYPDNAVEVITERFSYGFSALFSDIGGNLGFCVGLCLFSFVEIGVSALQLIGRRLWKPTRNP